jgi:hypothetical protein
MESFRLLRVSKERDVWEPHVSPNHPRQYTPTLQGEASTSLSSEVDFSWLKMVTTKRRNFRGAVEKKREGRNGFAAIE